jgi:hypothetical protein
MRTLRGVGHGNLQMFSNGDSIVGRSLRLTQPQSRSSQRAIARERWRSSCSHLPAEDRMRYIVAWMLGVPFSLIVLWYIVGHAACGR